MCDPDYGWLPGAEGTNKCYMLIKGFDASTCYSSDPWGGYGMDWFDAMQCCYYQNSYLAEPQTEAESSKINTYLTISTGGDRQNTWWMGATDMHHEGGWAWMSGAPWNYENWNEGEPNQNGNEDCGAFDSQADGFKVRMVGGNVSDDELYDDSGWIWSATLPTTGSLTTPSVRR